MHMDMGELLGNIVLIWFVCFLFAILTFLITRAFWCWYFKITARLDEQRKTNMYLEAIYKLLAQGNSISAVSAEALLNNSLNGGTAAGFEDSDIPDL